MRIRHSRCAAKLGAAGLIAVSLAGGAAADAIYDPLAIDAARRPSVMDVQIAGDDYAIPLRLYLPEPLAGSAPVVLFSHGLGGSRAGNAYCGKHWAARGYVAVFLQHPGSDESVWKHLPRAQRVAALREAANLRNFRRRVDDVRAALAALEAWNDAGSGHALARKLDLARIGMAGHSFGAVTTQAVAGQRAPLIGARFQDTRIRAALLMSPSKPRRGSAADAFDRVRIPWLLMTGTHDGGVIGGQTPATRLAVFPALAPGDKYELVLDRAEHSAFNDRALPLDELPRNPNHHRAILAISTAFWDAHLRADARALAWLRGAGARSVLETRDRWQRK